LCIGVYIASSGDALINDVNPSNFTIKLNTLRRRENDKGWQDIGLIKIMFNSRLKCYFYYQKSIAKFNHPTIASTRSKVQRLQQIQVGSKGSRFEMLTICKWHSLNLNIYCTFNYFLALINSQETKSRIYIYIYIYIYTLCWSFKELNLIPIDYISNGPNDWI
jgi:hypothetical protein